MIGLTVTPRDAPYWTIWFMALCCAAVPAEGVAKVSILARRMGLSPCETHHLAERPTPFEEGASPSNEVATIAGHIRARQHGDAMT